MEPTANPLRPTDVRTASNGPLTEATSGEAASGTSYALDDGKTPQPRPAYRHSADALSSWDGPGTAYTLMPAAAKPAQKAPLKPVDSPSAVESYLQAPTPKPSMNWPLIGGFAFGTLLTALLLLALWQPWEPESALDVPAESKAENQSPMVLEPVRQVTEKRPVSLAENLDNAIQEPVDDAPPVTPSSGAVPEDLPPPATHALTQSTPVDPLPAPAQALTPPPRNESVQPVRRPPAPTAPIEQARRTRPESTQAMTVTGKRPASPITPSSAPTPAATGTLTIVAQPWGQVWIDGKQRGITPPLFKLQLQPGSYTIELRNPDLPSYSQKVQISAGQSVTLRHSFQ